jgi:hypothetical protein
MEEWKPVVGWEGYYEVSTFGRVRSRARRTRAGWIKFKLHSGNVISQFGRQGRQYVNLFDGKRRQTCTVHRLVLEAFVGARPLNLECRHLDGNADNNQLDNLVWGTKLDNEADKVRHGTAKRMPLTVEEIVDIRHSPRKQQELADQYGVTQSLISRIKSGERRVGVP